MVSAVDTNILLDILLPDPRFLEPSKELLRKAVLGGKVIISEIVYAELSAQFSRQEELDAFLGDMGIIVQPSNRAALREAARAWLRYIRRRGKELLCHKCGFRKLVKCERCREIISTRQHIISDFLVGGHALVLADTLLTRDRGFYRTYFTELKLNAVAPEQ